MHILRSLTKQPGWYQTFSGLNRFVLFTIYSDAAIIIAFDRRPEGSPGAVFMRAVQRGRSFEIDLSAKRRLQVGCLTPRDTMMSSTLAVEV